GAPLAALPLLIRLSRRMVEIIRQNILWFAISVNIIGIALIAWLMPSLAPENRERSPLYAAIYHQIGSLLVLLNSMRLLWFEKTNWLQKLAQADTPFDRWLESWNLHDLSHWILERRRSVISVALILMLTAYLASMFHQVPADSIGIVNRCGAWQAAPLPPGLHLLRPWPWDRVHLLHPELIRRVEVGFRRSSSRSDSQTWSSAHRDSLLLSDDEALILTADGNLIEVQATLNYTIADAIIYLAGAQQLEELLRA
ncbi:MAG TPA: hypothetical protein PKA06_14590, partial [Gemmatales bacterium]|nr:hypothetical protein [Gemmatales bacterium]